jgi:hypothetical protein
MVFPIVEPEDGDRGTGGNQDPNGVIEFGPNAGDPNLIEEHLHDLSEAFLLFVWQRSEKGDVRLKGLFPRSGERLFHNHQPPEAAPPNQPVDKRTETQKKQRRRPEPARNRGGHSRRAGEREGMVTVSAIVLWGHQHGRLLSARMGKLFTIITGSILLLQFHFPQPQGIADDRDGTQAHRRASNDRAEQQAEERVPAATVFGSNAMPHLGQSPRWSCWTSGCIGHV